jgi:hypothetical protein
MLARSTAKWIHRWCLVLGATAYRSPKERQPDTLARNEYTDLEAPEDESEAGEDIPPREASKTAIVVYGDGAGTTRKVCTDPNCPVHHPHRVVPVDPEAEARQRELEKELESVPHTRAASLSMISIKPVWLWTQPSENSSARQPRRDEFPYGFKRPAWMQLKRPPHLSHVRRLSRLHSQANFQHDQNRGQ